MSKSESKIKSDGSKSTYTGDKNTPVASETAKKKRGRQPGEKMLVVTFLGELYRLKKSDKIQVFQTIAMYGNQPDTVIGSETDQQSDCDKAIKETLIDIGCEPFEMPEASYDLSTLDKFDAMKRGFEMLK